MTTSEKLLIAGKLLFSRPRLFFLYGRKFCVEKTVYPFFSLVKSDRYRKKMEDVVFEIDFKNFPEVQLYAMQMLFGFYEISTVEYMRKTLKGGDIFVDVGAHVGYLSAAAASLVGKEGQIHSFEPIPPTFRYLQKLTQNNPRRRIFLNNFALGDKAGIIAIDYKGFLHSGSSSAVPGFLPQQAIEKSFEVKSMRLDDYFQERGLHDVSLIKIDVEGYEFNVLRGLQNYLEDTKERPQIICEIAPHAYSHLGTTAPELIGYMRQYGYKAYDILFPWREIDITKFREGTNVVWKTG